MKQSSSWLHAAAVYTDPRAVVLFFLGFSAGVPIMLIFSSLSLWLSEAGVSRDMVTMFSWAALAYSFKFVWAPLIDSLPLPVFGRLGWRRSWLLLSQAAVASAIVWMAMVDPAQPGALAMMAAAAVLLGFSSATQDVVIDAYRIEAAGDDTAMQSVTSATYNAGYRVGMIVSGAGALYAAETLGSKTGHYVYAAWQQTYLLMAAVMAVGMATVLLMREPEVAARADKRRSLADSLRLIVLFLGSVSAFAAMFSWFGGLFSKQDDALLGLLVEAARLTMSVGAAGLAGAFLVWLKIVPKQLAVDTWVTPVADFFRRYGPAAFGFNRAVPHFGYCGRGDFQCVLSGNGVQQKRNRGGGENLRRGDGGGGWFPRRAAVAAVFADEDDDGRRGAGFSHQSAVHHAGLSRARRVVYVFGGRFRQFGFGVGGRGVRCLPLFADEYPFHRRTIRHFQFADDLATENAGRLFRHDCEQNRLPGLFPVYRADRPAGAVAGVLGR